VRSDFDRLLDALPPVHEAAGVPPSGENLRGRRRWRIRLATFLMLPVVCAVGLVVVRWPRVPFEERLKQEDAWIVNPTTAKFWPEGGEVVRWGDPVLKVAWFRARPGQFVAQTRVSRLVDGGGLVREWSHVTWDRWSGKYSLPPGSSAALPGLLAKLPPSDPAAAPADILAIAYPEWGRWVVRKYRVSAAPREALAVSAAVAQGPTEGK
jgi:hypothetical protein